MRFVRVLALLIALLFSFIATLSSSVHARQSEFTCEDFITQTAAQAHLDRFPDDPYGLDLDGNGIACEEMLTGTDTQTEPTTGTVVPEDERLPLDARLGGTVESWQAEFGLPVEREGEHADLFTEYDIPGLGTVFADDHLGRIHSVTLFSPRPEGQEWSDDPHEMNWLVQEAHEIAQQFLPRDVRLDETLDEGSDFSHTLCSSDALAAEVPQEIYDYVDNTPQYGRCSYVLFYENFGMGDRISWISIDLQIEEPLEGEASALVEESGNEAPVVNLPQGDADEFQVGITAEEAAYSNEIGSILTEMGASMDRIVPLFANPRYGDQDWIIDVAVELFLWQSSYEAAAALVPPASMTDIHATVVESLRLYSEAADDIANGIDTLNPALVAQANDKMAQGLVLINQANILMNEFMQERGL